MLIFNKKFDVNVFKLVILTAIIVALILFFIFFNATENSKTASIFSGLLTGVIVAIMQLFLSWYEFKKMEKFESMKIIDIRPDRDKREFYANLIVNSTKRIYIMGVTADRFLNDFADIDNTLSERKVLFAALTRDVEVRILLPDKEFLQKERQQQHFENIKTSFAAIRDSHQNFENRYFQHTPSHSIFVIDDKCILGPVFPEINSKDTPAIYFEDTSPYAVKYLEYFESEWSKSS
ncbi:hypothetical protein [Mucilaginibacter sp.]|uniref:hypothetical protein n=1 Tax=Mucilaginibacter sp. TaxID=1882438 RepID=UPI0032651EAE